ncbi:MAG TPA: tRNA 5-methoxyuridine(34)/uridine 5-oxyacetic acid(34) synthase CmoB [Woeseiaceae bacterium]|nr:tRNA 5-methoxyuridine(34)/uridine 5-oxyacetic acid(34) synthase CmoB [Woeseiaceae bacterium]
MNVPDTEALAGVLETLQLGHWFEPLRALALERMSPAAHGDFARWRDAVVRLPAASGAAERRELLLQLAPWRKGPFDVGGVHIDAEWQSDLKWRRVEAAVAPLAGRRVLDVGCGNGYYALRMAEAGASAVLGIDPTLLYVMQFLAVTAQREPLPVVVLPLRLEELPDAAPVFDTTFSMGVLYHQRSPLEHLRQLRATLRPGGQLVLETIFIPGEESYACTPADRYARMKNVWLLPTLAELTTWLRRTGFRDVEVVAAAVTTTEEQRSTEWMRFESLAEALDPADPGRTVEGWPAPRRVVATAIAP